MLTIFFYHFPSFLWKIKTDLFTYLCHWVGTWVHLVLVEVRRQCSGVSSFLDLCWSRVYLVSVIVLRTPGWWARHLLGNCSVSASRLTTGMVGLWMSMDTLAVLKVVFSDWPPCQACVTSAFTYHVISVASQYFLSYRVSHWTGSSSILLEWLTSKTQGPSCHCL